MDYTIAYCIPATRNKTQNTALIFMTSVILCKKLYNFSQINQFGWKIPFNCVNFKQALPIKAYIPTDDIPVLPLRPAVPSPSPPIPACFFSFLSVHSMRPAGKHVSQCSASFSFVFLSLSKPCPPPQGNSKAPHPPEFR